MVPVSLLAQALLEPAPDEWSRLIKLTKSNSGFLSNEVLALPRSLDWANESEPYDGAMVEALLIVRRWTV
jgi:hypothetical protein